LGASAAIAAGHINGAEPELPNEKQPQPVDESFSVTESVGVHEPAAAGLHENIAALRGRSMLAASLPPVVAHGLLCKSAQSCGASTKKAKRSV
jgi:hypothetical protein